MSALPLLACPARGKNTIKQLISYLRWHLRRAQRGGPLGRRLCRVKGLSLESEAQIVETWRRGGAGEGRRPTADGGWGCERLTGYGAGRHHAAVDREQRAAQPREPVSDELCVEPCVSGAASCRVLVSLAQSGQRPGTLLAWRVIRRPKCSLTGWYRLFQQRAGTLVYYAEDSQDPDWEGRRGGWEEGEGHDKKQRTLLCDQSSVAKRDLERLRSN